jgi:hypothetical protein
MLLLIQADSTRGSNNLGLRGVEVHVQGLLQQISSFLCLDSEAFLDIAEKEPGFPDFVGTAALARALQHLTGPPPSQGLNSRFGPFMESV